MSDRTHIEWTDATWSVVTGCTRVSEGCRHCYIERTPPFRIAGRRFNHPEIGATTGVKLHSDRLGWPMRWRKPRRIFACSLADLFHDEVPDKFIAEVWAVMAMCRWRDHQFQVLTKRPARMRALLSDTRFERMVERAVLARDCYFRLDAVGWPLPNVWLGVSVETQQWADIRIPALLDTPAAVRWLSCEPLLGPVDLTRWTTWSDGSGRFSEPPLVAGLDWVVCGGESGPGARPMHPDWARSLLDQCQDAAVPFFFKQWGGRTPKAGGRQLDGRTWDQQPAGQP